MSSTSTRGRIAALLLTTPLSLACPADDGDDTAADSGSSGTTAPGSESTDPDGSSSSTAPSTSGSDASSSDAGDASDDGSSSDGSDSGSSSGSADSESGSETAAEQLAIIGDWIDPFDGGHVISETEWVQTYGPDSFVYAIDHYDNDAEVVVAQSEDDDTWSRFDWVYVDEQLYYCQTAFGLDTAAEADATPRADDSDPSMLGCGGFSWSSLTPQ